MPVRPSVQDQVSKEPFRKKTRLDPEAFYDFIDFHRLWYESMLCHTGRVLEPCRCVKGPFQNNLQPVLKHCWKLQILTHSYKNNDVTIKSQTLSHGYVPSDHFWKICDRCKHPSCNFDFPSTRIENMCFQPGPLFGPWPSVKGAIPEKTPLDPEAF